MDFQRQKEKKSVALAWISARTSKQGTKSETNSPYFIFPLLPKRVQFARPAYLSTAGVPTRVTMCENSVSILDIPKNDAPIPSVMRCIGSRSLLWTFFFIGIKFPLTGLLCAFLDIVTRARLSPQKRGLLAFIQALRALQCPDTKITIQKKGVVKKTNTKKKVCGKNQRVVNWIGKKGTEILINFSLLTIQRLGLADLHLAASPFYSTFYWFQDIVTRIACKAMSYRLTVLLLQVQYHIGYSLRV